MKKKEAIERIRREIHSASTMSYLTKDNPGLKKQAELDVEAFEMAIKALEEYTAGWTLTSKELPDYYENVLVQRKFGKIGWHDIMALHLKETDKPDTFALYWISQESGVEYEVDEVVAWMPLPELCEVEDD